MLALVLNGTPGIRRDYPEPTRAAGEALIETRLAGVCDTDLQLARGYMDYRGVLGHEFVGEVVECDDPSWLGRRVVGDINAGCGLCESCRTDNGHHCGHRSVLGILGRDGALAQRLVLPERNLVGVPDSVTDERAVFAEPLAAAAHVLDDIGEAKRALVLGDGKLGTLVALVLQSAGVEVTLVGHHRAKLALAEAHGVSVALESALDPGAVFPVVVEATGRAAGLQRALGATEPRGTVILKTTVADAHQIDTSLVVINEIKLVGSRCGDLGKAIGLLESNAVDPTALISCRFPLSEAHQALQKAAKPGVMKVLVEP